MNLRRMIRPTAALVCGVAFLVKSASATSNHTYNPGEYVTVVDGRAPDGKYAIATHGDGDLGYEHFHVYLMDARTGKKIGPLEETAKNPLDTGADAYYAKWSADSSEVSITYRADRHVAVKITYLIAKGRAFRTKGPTEVDGLPPH